jgi:hypothetical protein
MDSSKTVGTFPRILNLNRLIYKEQGWHYAIFFFTVGFSIVFFRKPNHLRLQVSLDCGAEDPMLTRGGANYQVPNDNINP